MSAPGHVHGHPSDEDISAFTDGDLPARDAQRIREHVGACDACQARTASFAALVGAARELEAPEPPVTLWPIIEGELARREAFIVRLRPYLIGALSGALAVVLALGASLRLTRAPAPVFAAEAALDPLLREADAEFEAAASQYERSIGKLVGLLSQAEPAWSAPARARYRERLDRLDEGIARLREAVRGVPGDTARHEMLFAAYQRKITFLSETIHRGREEAMP